MNKEYMNISTIPNCNKNGIIWNPNTSTKMCLAASLIFFIGHPSELDVTHIVVSRSDRMIYGDGSHHCVNENLRGTITMDTDVMMQHFRRDIDEAIVPEHIDATVAVVIPIHYMLRVIAGRC